MYFKQIFATRSFEQEIGLVWGTAFSSLRFLSLWQNLVNVSQNIFFYDVTRA